ncbi:MAG: hypothetical protein HY788_06835 [Deltaproteobacteria bacterium]|nr:hypothetical protein [Deltaproteobacteria bacterium]
MSNFILSYSFVDFTPTASTEHASFPAENIADLSKPSAEYRSTNALQTTIVLDTGAAATAIAAVYIGGVNFTSMTIQGNETDSWGAPSFTLAATIAQDAELLKRKAFIALTGFAYRYMRLVIPVQTRTDGEGFYRIGVVALMSTAAELPINPQYNYERAPGWPHEEVELDGGGIETLILGLCMRFEAELEFQARQTHEATFHAINAVQPGQPFIFYENGWHSGGTEKAYLVRIQKPLSIKWEADSYFSTNRWKLVEIV